MSFVTLWTGNRWLLGVLFPDPLNLIHTHPHEHQEAQVVTNRFIQSNKAEDNNSGLVSSA